MSEQALRDVRTQITAIDRRIADLLVERCRLALLALKAKRGAGFAWLRDFEREVEVIEGFVARCVSGGVPKDEAGRAIRGIIDAAARVQLEADRVGK